MKQHLKKVVGQAKLTLCPLPELDEGLEALTPGHFLIGRPLEALPDSSLAYQPNSLLHRSQLCQALVRHFWQRWSNEYDSPHKKWNNPNRNLQVGDLVDLSMQRSSVLFGLVMF